MDTFFLSLHLCSCNMTIDPLMKMRSLFPYPLNLWVVCAFSWGQWDISAHDYDSISKNICASEVNPLSANCQTCDWGHMKSSSSDHFAGWPETHEKTSQRWTELDQSNRPRIWPTENCEQTKWWLFEATKLWSGLFIAEVNNIGWQNTNIMDAMATSSSG